MTADVQKDTTLAPVKLSLGYKIVWGVAALGTSLISGIYAALLPSSTRTTWGCRRAGSASPR